MHPALLELAQHNRQAPAGGHHRVKHHHADPLTNALGHAIEIAAGLRRCFITHHTHVRHARVGQHILTTSPEPETSPQDWDGQHRSGWVHHLALTTGQGCLHRDAALGQPISGRFIGEPAAELFHRCGKER